MPPEKSHRPTSGPDEAAAPSAQLRQVSGGGKAQKAGGGRTLGRSGAQASKRWVRPLLVGEGRGSGEAGRGPGAARPGHRAGCVTCQPAGGGPCGCGQCRSGARPAKLRVGPAPLGEGRGLLAGARPEFGTLSTKTGRGPRVRGGAAGQGWGQLQAQVSNAEPGPRGGRRAGPVGRWSPRPRPRPAGSPRGQSGDQSCEEQVRPRLRLLRQASVPKSGATYVLISFLWRENLLTALFKKLKKVEVGQSLSPACAFLS